MARRDRIVMVKLETPKKVMLRNGRNKEQHLKEDVAE